ncbi:type ISP restriction/modification enzyme [Arsenicicoccus bolidensis]|uniref:type ISP restriction/modification enzyme n=1 Tax=Arsenicicoccus bolidensis TaxID=229480 RepID=UPI0028AA60FF|nr:type ISP restriction/modification enzyme [Arsenicicoccus bolidensis]
MIGFYNQQALTNDGTEESLDLDATKISWSRNIRRRALNGVTEEFIPDHLRSTAIYRPFCKQAVYFDPVFNSVPGKNATYFPTPHHGNLGFGVIESGARAPFSLLMQNALPDSKTYVDAAQFFPRWTYEKPTDDGALFGAAGGVADEWGYRRVDNITDAILSVYTAKFGPGVSKDDIFFYVYGVLHSTQYREAFAADLKRMLPRIPLAASTADFHTFAEAGRRLSDLHVGYEQVKPYPLHEQAPIGVDEWELYRVTKMKWQNKETKKELIYNSHITLGDIPAEAHEYMLGSRSALEWLIDRYQVKTDKASGIVNDPNDWAREHNDPRYIIDLAKRVTRVSVETVRIVKTLPELPLN